MKNDNKMTLNQLGKITLLAGGTIMLLVSLRVGLIIAILGLVAWIASKAES